ncbi:hypothetical protein WMY93_016563 [Mugilogobius chulae]|uniref:Uncharacterized protein n=1 Tax=Mugilogobius chulae TaxID=88201 RepID=A0AAW0NXF9_9GOBI
MARGDADRDGRSQSQSDRVSGLPAQQAHHLPGDHAQVGGHLREREKTVAGLRLRAVTKFSRPLVSSVLLLKTSPSAEILLTQLHKESRHLFVNVSPGKCVFDQSSPVSVTVLRDTALDVLVVLVGGTNQKIPHRKTQGVQDSSLHYPRADWRSSCGDCKQDTEKRMGSRQQHYPARHPSIHPSPPRTARLFFWTHHRLQRVNEDEKYRYTSGMHPPPPHPGEETSGGDEKEMLFSPIPVSSNTSTTLERQYDETKNQETRKETNADLERAEDPELALAEHDSANDANTGNTKMDDEPNEVLRAIRDLKTTMNDRFNILEESLSSTKASVADLSARTHEVEKASSDHENRLSLVETTLAAIRSENNLLRQKVVDLEARSRRQNIKIVGLPEKIENGCMEDFLSRFLPQLLGPDHFDKPVMVDRAHRLGVRAPEAGGRPRVTIARIHSCQTKEKFCNLHARDFPFATTINPSTSFRIILRR